MGIFSAIQPTACRGIAGLPSLPATRATVNRPSAPMQHMPKPNSTSGRSAAVMPWNSSTSTRGSSQQKQSRNVQIPASHSWQPLDVSGSQRARTIAERNTSAASICQTMAVGSTRCQLELFSIKRLSTPQ